MNERIMNRTRPINVYNIDSQARGNETLSDWSNSYTSTAI